MPGLYTQQLSRSMQSTTACPYLKFMSGITVKHGFSTKLHEMITDGSLRPAYWQHPVFTADPSLGFPPSPVAPWVQYVDAVLCAQQESVLRFWCDFLVTGTGTLCAVRDGAACALRSRAGDQLSSRSAMVFINGDWAEYAATSTFQH